MYQQKRMISEHVRVRFARFGDEVLGIVLGYAIQSKRMPVLLHKFGLKAPPDLDAQLTVLFSFIAERGAREFVKGVRHEKRAEVQPEEVLDEPESAEGEADFAEAKNKNGAAPLPADAHQTSSSVVVIQNPGYCGPERRSGLERRTGSDRRGGIAAIRKNSRFGGDRRKKPRGRRKADHV